MLLNIILENNLDKKTLIIVELPELFANDEEMKQFKILVDEAVDKGYQFILISNEDELGVGNYYYKNKIVHLALLEQIKQKVCHEVPFYCPDELYDKAKTLFLKLVDNSISEADLMNLEKENFSALITIIYVIMYNLDMDPIHIPQGLESNIQKFIASLN